jgi:uncharacterized membrane protein
MSWVLFSLLAAFLWALSNVIDKVALSRLVKNPMVPLAVYGVLSIVAVGLVVLGGAFESFSSRHFALAMLGGTFHALMVLFYFKAVAADEISKIIPLFALGPLFIAVVAAVTLGEIFSFDTYIGIVLILVGSVTLSVQRLQTFSVNKAFWFMIITTFSLAMGEVISKYLLSFYNFWSVFAYTRLGSLIVVTPIAWHYRRDVAQLLRKGKRKALAMLSTSESLNILAILCIIIAASTGYVTLVNAMTQVQPFFVLAMSVLLTLVAPHLLKEELSLKIFVRKFLSILMMSLGAILVATS